MSEAILANALALRRTGKLAEADSIYREILREQPEHFEALHALGIIRYQEGQLAEAERLIGEAVRINPGASDAQYNRGSLLLKLNRPDDALACFTSALATRPDYAEALGNRGTVLMHLGQYAEALADFTKLGLLKPNLPEAWLNHGAALVKLKRFEEASASYERALRLKPGQAEARKQHGAIALVRGKFADALHDADEWIAANTGNSDAWELRANALAELGRRDEAVASYDQALRLKPANADALYNRANNLSALRRFDEAAQDYARARQVAPDYPFARGAEAFCKRMTCEWQNFDRMSADVTTDLRAGIAVAPFHALVHCPSPADALVAARIFSARKYPAAPVPLWNGETYRHDKIRIAYLSGNFHQHAVARLMAGVFECHDLARFELYAISFGPDDNGPMRARLSQTFDRFVDVRTETAERTAQNLRQMEIDIAVDLMGFTEDCRPAILPQRPAPVQVNFLGYAGTMGADYIDYIIADETVIPKDQFVDYAEKVVQLPHCYLPGGGARSISQDVPSRADAGLPDKGFVFCAFHHVYKITPPLFDIWMRLLCQVEGSVLWLSQTNATATTNLRREAEARGVSANRLVFANVVASDADHLARLKLADLFLDALPYNAHATASDALWAGVPVLSVSGTTFAGRVATSLLKAVGIVEMIAPSLEAYEAEALRLARDPVALDGLKTKLLHNQNRAPLFDTAGYTRDLESAYIAMWERSQRGLSPEAFAVGRRS